MVEGAALTRKPTIAAVVSLLLLRIGVANTIDLNGEPRSRAIEVEYVGPDGVLPSNAAAERVPADVHP